MKNRQALTKEIMESAKSLRDWEFNASKEKAAGIKDMKETRRDA